MINPKSITIKRINKHLGVSDAPNGVHHTTISDININSRGVVGTVQDFINITNNDFLRFKHGNWKIYDHYDHLYFMYGHHESFDINNKLYYEKETEAAGYYGYMSKKDLELANEEMDEDSELYDRQIYEIYNSYAGSFLNVGRGDDGFYLYIAKNAKNKIVAWALLNDDSISFIIGNN